MNKKEFIKELEKRTGYTQEECNTINSILEDTFLIGKKNKEKMIEKFESALNLDEMEANKLYETVMELLSTEIKNKLRHPFKSQD